MFRRAFTIGLCCLNGIAKEFTHTWAIGLWQGWTSCREVCWRDWPDKLHFRGGAAHQHQYGKTDNHVLDVHFLFLQKNKAARFVYISDGVDKYRGYSYGEVAKYFLISQIFIMKHSGANMRIAFLPFWVNLLIR